MHVLVSNDDGFQAPGLAELIKALEQTEHRITVVAPRTNKSGSGQALTLRERIKVSQHRENYFIVDGTPADCVYIGLHCLADSPVDVVVSGINNGANVADAILYSGTVAAAMEARRLEYPSIAVSIDARNPNHFASAAQVAVDMLNHVAQLSELDQLAVLNVNVPDRAYNDLADWQLTRLGSCLAALPPVKVDEIGQDAYYELAPSGDFNRDADRGDGLKLRDFEALEQGIVSVTPLSSQLIHDAFDSELIAWLADLKTRIGVIS